MQSLAEKFSDYFIFFQTITSFFRFKE